MLVNYLPEIVLNFRLQDDSLLHIGNGWRSGELFFDVWRLHFLPRESSVDHFSTRSTFKEWHVVLAIMIRKVKIPSLDDAKYVTVMAYIATAISLIILVISLTLVEYTNTYAAICATSSIIGRRLFLMSSFCAKGNYVMKAVQTQMPNSRSFSYTGIEHVVFHFISVTFVDISPCYTSSFFHFFIK